MQFAGGEIQGTSKIVLRILIGCHNRLLAPFGHPGHTDLRQQVDFNIIGKDHYLMGLQL
jgi:hypothetical protein